MGKRIHWLVQFTSLAILLVLIVAPRATTPNRSKGEDEAFLLGRGSTEAMLSVRGMSAATAPITGTLRAHPTNGRYFTDDTGRPIYLTGSHVWYNLQDLGPSSPPPTFDFGAYLDFLSANNHNFIRLWRWELSKYTYGTISYAEPHPWERTGPGNALDGGLKYNLTEFNQDYFDRLRAYVTAAENRGIYVAIMLFEGHALSASNSPWRWDGHPMNVNNNINGINGDPDDDHYGIEIMTYPEPAGVNAIQKAYVSKIVDTVNDLDNVLYEISNESGFYSKEWQYDMINHIQTYQSGKAKQHPVGMTYEWSRLGPGPNSDLFESDADWVSPGGSFYRDDMPASDAAAQVILLDTDHIFGVGGDRDWIWKAFTRGMNPIYMDPIQFGHPDSLDPAQSQKTSEIVSARAAMGDTRMYADKMADLAAMVPHEELTTTGYALANPGREYLVYQPGSGSFTVTIAAGTYTYEWFNPVTSTITEKGSVTVISGDEDFTPPFGGTAVLYLRLDSAISLSPPVVFEDGVVNAASFAPPPNEVAPGSIVAVFGNNLTQDGQSAPGSFFDSNGKLSTSLAGASVTMNGISAPLLAAFPGQLNIQVPVELAGQTSASLQVTVAGQASTPRTVFLDSTDPGIFLVPTEVSATQGAIQNASDATFAAAVGSVPGRTARPARPGQDVLVISCTGLGDVTPPLATGDAALLHQTVQPVMVLIDGLPVAPLFSGLTPTLVGLNQINVPLPAGTSVGNNIPIVVMIGGKTSNTATIAVGP